MIGLGYVGLPLALQFGKHFNVIAFDINSKRVNELQNGNDVSNEIVMNFKIKIFYLQTNLKIYRLLVFM